MNNIRLSDHIHHMHNDCVESFARMYMSEPKRIKSLIDKGAMWDGHHVVMPQAGGNGYYHQSKPKI